MKNYSQIFSAFHCFWSYDTKGYVYLFIFCLVLFVFFSLPDAIYNVNKSLKKKSSDKITP